jgi:hypothetical protein
MSSRGDTTESESGHEKDPEASQPTLPGLSPPGRRCTAAKADGSRCRAWAVKGSEPPRCAAHSGRVGAPEGNKNAWKHGGYAAPETEIRGIGDAVEDIEKRLTRLAQYLDGCPDEEMFPVMALYGQMISRYGRLLRDSKVLSDEAADDILDALSRAWELLGAEMGWASFAN